MDRIERPTLLWISQQRDYAGWGWTHRVCQVIPSGLMCWRGDYLISLKERSWLCCCTGDMCNCLFSALWLVTKTISWLDNEKNVDNVKRLYTFANGIQWWSAARVEISHAVLPFCDKLISQMGLRVSSIDKDARGRRFRMIESNWRNVGILRGGI